MRIVLFDIDGTLIHTAGAGMAAMAEALFVQFGHREIIGAVPTAGRTDRGIVRDLFDLYAIEHSSANWNRLVDTYLAQLSIHMAQRAGAVLPGVAPLVAELAARDDVRLGLLTGNVERGARAKLEFFDLWRYFPFGGFGDEHFDRDDVARAALESARRSLPPGSTLESVWVIGDTPLDVSCARAIGARAIGVATGLYRADELEPHQPDLLLESLADPHELRTAMGF